MVRRLVWLVIVLTLVVAGCAPSGGAGGGAGSADAGKALFKAKACDTCHALAAAGATGTIGPKLDGIGSAAANRKPGMTAEQYIRESITNPQGFVVPGFDDPSSMPPGLATGKEVDDLVAFLLTQK